jgi:AraC-like DNA-binding protein
MSEPARQPDLPQRLTRLLEQGSGVFGLNLVFKPTLVDLRLPASHEQHLTPPCRAFKKRHGPQACIDFDILETPEALRGRPRGRIHTCPAGYTEIAVPVTSEGNQVGVLFAGPCWTKPGRKAHRDLIRVKEADFLEDRRELLRALAGRIAEIYTGHVDEAEAVPAVEDRRALINQFIETHLGQPVSLPDLAVAMSLSPSRAGHVVRQVTGLTFSSLLRRARLRHAAHLLISTDLPIGDVAYRCGLEDQSYFSRLFKSHYDTTPRAYRKAHHRVERG